MRKLIIIQVTFLLGLISLGVFLWNYDHHQDFKLKQVLLSVEGLKDPVYLCVPDYYVFCDLNPPHLNVIDKRITWTSESTVYRVKGHVIKESIISGGDKSKLTKEEDLPWNKRLQ